MGGYGSTRWGGVACRPTVQGTPGLSVAALRPVCAYTTDPNEPVRQPVLIEYSTVPAGGAVGRQVVDLEAEPQPFGGVRWWLMCPACERKVARLYLAPPRSIWRCRSCCRLTYASQRRSRMYRVADRLTDRAVTIARQLDWDWVPYGEPPPRPKGMHQSRYRRLRAELARIEAMRDNEFLRGAVRILRRAGGSHRHRFSRYGGSVQLSRG